MSSRADKGSARAAEILRKRREYLVPCVHHFYDDPMELVSGEMQYVTDSSGRRYLDFFSGVSVTSCGHCNPFITEAVVEQARTLQHVCSIYLTEPVVDLAQLLAEVTPGALRKSFFCNSGTEANEGAMLAARLATGRSELIALSMGLHGRTHLAMTVTGLAMWRTDPFPSGGVAMAPNPYCYRCSLRMTYPGCGLACVEQLEQTIKTATSLRPAAMIAETIQGNGGIIVPPKDYFREVKKVLDEYGALLIIDEVQTGFCRTGRWFAIEHFGVDPDIMTMAKALGNGVPIGAYIATDEVASKFTRPSASTLGGNPVSCAAGIAVINYMRTHALADRARQLGDRLMASLDELALRHPIIGEVRGMGLMVGVELVRDRSTKEPAARETDMVLERMKSRGILVGKNGIFRNVIALQPSLVITEDDVERLVGELSAALAEVEASA